MNKIMESIKKDPLRSIRIASIGIAASVFTVATVIMARKYTSHLDQVYAVIAEHASEIVIQSSKIAVKN